MAQFLKPDNLNSVWASGGDRIYPGDTKYVTGWQVEIPPRQYFNEIDYKQDQMLAHINQHGISHWDDVTEYFANKSRVQGVTNGVVYECVTTHGGSVLAAQNPELDASNLYWRKAFLDINDFSANQDLSASGYIDLPGGLILQWKTVTVSSGGGLLSNFPKPFSNIVLFCGPGEITESTGEYFFAQVVGTTLTQFNVAVYGGAAGSAPIAKGSMTVKIFAVGV
jgi:hypothetical protein